MANSRSQVQLSLDRGRQPLSFVANSIRAAVGVRSKVTVYSKVAATQTGIATRAPIPVPPIAVAVTSGRGGVFLDFRVSHESPSTKYISLRDQPMLFDSCTITLTSCAHGPVTLRNSRGDPLEGGRARLHRDQAMIALPLVIMHAGAPEVSQPQKSRDRAVKTPEKLQLQAGET